MNPEQQYLNKCLISIVDKLNWGNSNEWKNSHFNRLSKQIFNASNIVISPRTLRRLYDNQAGHKYNPQIETKNALAIFIGFESWDHYLSSQPRSADKLLNQEKYEQSTKKNIRLPGSLPELILIIIGMAIFILSALFFYNRYLNHPVFTFYAADTIGMTPLNVTFFYDVSKVRSDSIYINFGNKRTWYKVSKEKNRVQHVYMAPISTYASLIIDSKVVKKISVFAQSNGWETGVIDDNNFYPVKYAIQTGNPSYIYIPEEEFRSLGSIINRKNCFSKFLIVRDFNISMDSSSIEIRMKADEEMTEVKCQEIAMVIKGKTNRITIHFVTPGCQHNLRIEISDFGISGINEILSDFEKDIRLWHIIRLEIRDLVASVFFDDVKIYTAGYTKLIGDIEAIYIKASGRGALDYVRLYNLNDSLVYAEEFNGK